MVHAGYWLNFPIKLDEGGTEHYCVNREKHKAPTEGK